jgi:TonB family protein
MNKLFTFFVTLLFAVSSSSAQTSAVDFAKSLELELKGKVYMLRGFPIEGTIAFDANCEPATVAYSGSWTTASIEVDGIEAHGNDIVIIGKRYGFAFDKKTKTLVQRKLKQGKGPEGDTRIQLTIQGPLSGSPDSFVRKVKEKIFLIDTKEMPQLVPSYWRRYFTDSLNRKSESQVTHGTQSSAITDVQDKKTSDGMAIYHVGKAVKPPRPVYSPDPDYSEPARASKFQGVSVLAAVILPTGMVGDISIVRPIGLGLDEKAVEAIKTWRFQPAMRGNEPVAVAVNVEVQFNLY